jgi:hypothetical protein
MSDNKRIGNGWLILTAFLLYISVMTIDVLYHKNEKLNTELTLMEIKIDSLAMVQLKTYKELDETIEDLKNCQRKTVNLNKLQKLK